MINFVYGKKYLAQLKQLEFLCQDHHKIVLTGDFNTWSKKRMNSLVSLTKSLGLDQVNFKMDGHKKRYLPYPLDHIFYKNLNLESTKILQSVKTSDHKPIIVSFIQKL
jgi:endonuclease/exonuclease/phosphatase (EEP) superfamily protein YafD